MRTRKDLRREEMAARALLLGGGSPLLLILIVALMGFHPTAFWVIAASVATVAMYVSAIYRYSRLGSLPPPLPAPKSSARLFVTDKDKRCAESGTATWREMEHRDLAQARISVRSTETFQGIIGFGAATTGAALNCLSHMTPELRAPLMEELFSANQMNLNVCRTSIGASDYSEKLHSCDREEGSNKRDENLERFTIEFDREYVLPMLREARAVNPDLFLLASPWSPPGWMKANGSMLGGSMRLSSFPFYAQYFVKYLQAYNAEGVPIQAVTIQNEVETDQDGNMPACIWPMGYEADFVKWHLGPALAQANLPVDIWIIDHNYDLWGRATQVLEDADLRKYAKGIAWHGYLGTVEMVSRVKEAHPDIEMYFTEHTPVLGAPDYLTDWTNWGKIIGGTMRNWCRNFTIWNLALDETGKPNIGPFGCGGLVTINSKTHEVTRSGAYWGMAHYSKFVKRGAKRIASTGDFDGLTHVAFRNPNGEHVLVLSNSGETRTIPVEMGEMVTAIQMEKDSVVTLVWS